MSVPLRSPAFRSLALVLAAFSCAGMASASDKKPEDYPFRLHIFSRAEHTHYHRGMQDFSQGEGRANLFANGEVHAVDFHFDCGSKIERSLGYETYMVKWHKPGKQLTVLFPIFGESGKFFTCDIDTDVKPDVAYVSHNGSLITEPAAEFKAWMLKHNYDPEQGRNMPAAAEPAQVGMDDPAGRASVRRASIRRASMRVKATGNPGVVGA